MYKTRKECRDETGLEPEYISELARNHPAMVRLQKQGQVNGLNNHDQRVEFVYEGMKHHHKRMQKLVRDEMEDVRHNDSTCPCMNCERVRRVRYMKARRTDPDTKSRYY